MKKRPARRKLSERKAKTTPPTARRVANDDEAREQINAQLGEALNDAHDCAELLNDSDLVQILNAIFLARARQADWSRLPDYGGSGSPGPTNQYIEELANAAGKVIREATRGFGHHRPPTSRAEEVALLCEKLGQELRWLVDDEKIMLEDGRILPVDKTKPALQLAQTFVGALQQTTRLRRIASLPFDDGCCDENEYANMIATVERAYTAVALPKAAVNAIDHAQDYAVAGFEALGLDRRQQRALNLFEAWRKRFEKTE